MVMTRRLRSLVFALGLALTSSAWAGPSVDSLIERLREGEDFRVRVQAALELGKSKSQRAREPLESALDDKTAAVRAAAAAALKTLGDRKAIPALERHKDDESESVRKQIAASLEALRKSNAKPKVLVELTGISVKDSRAQSLKPWLERESRASIAELPGVGVVEAGKDAVEEANRLKLPLVRVSGRVKNIKETSGSSGEVTLSASLELVVHRMPGQTLAGTVSGSASTTADASELKDGARGAELRRSVLTAALAGAVRRAPTALLAAAK
jgi:hypothetical protein